MPARPVLVATLILLLAACDDVTPAPAPVDPGGSWELVEATIDGAPLEVVDGHRITLDVTVAGGTASLGGSAGCNSYFADAELGGNTLRIGETGSTAMACEPEAVMAAEERYLAALGVVDTMTRTGVRLVLSGPGTELTFGPVAPVDTLALTGTAWRLDTIITGEAASTARGDPATLRLDDDGTIAGSTGCRPFTGTYVVTGDTVTVTELAMGDIVCPPRLADQDSHVVTVIGDGFVPVIENERLTLESMGGLGLAYLAG